MNLDDIGVFAVDWDETITSEDSLKLVSRAAYEQKPDFEPQWDHFVNEYSKDYNEYSKGKKRDTLENETEFLKGLKQIELNSIKRVEDSGLFRGLREQDIASQASNVKYQKGWWELASRLKNKKIPIIIISVNWSAAMIKQAFENHGFFNHRDDDDKIKVYANIMPKGNDGLTTGQLRDTYSSGIRTAQDKLDIFNQIANDYAARDDGGGDIYKSGKKAVYCGDSSTDMIALRRADIGFVLGNSNTFNKFIGLGFGREKLRFLNDWTELL